MLFCAFFEISDCMLPTSDCMLPTFYFFARPLHRFLNHIHYGNIFQQSAESITVQYDGKKVVRFAQAYKFDTRKAGRQTHQ